MDFNETELNNHQYKTRNYFKQQKIKGPWDSREESTRYVHRQRLTKRARCLGSYSFTPSHRRKKRPIPLAHHRNARPVLTFRASKSMAVSGATPSSQMSSACSDS